MDTTQHKQGMRELSLAELDTVSGGKKNWLLFVLHVLEYVVQANDFIRHKPERRHEQLIENHQ